MDDRIQVYTGGSVMCNGYLLRAEGGYIAIDAPLGFTEWILRRLPQGETISHLLLTHQHFDHVQDAALLQQKTSCRVHACSPYSKSLTLADQAALWGIRPPDPYTVDDAFGSQTRHATWGGLNWNIHHIPGHSPDGIAYELPDWEAMWPGDILFAGSIGRTDFPGGSARQLTEGIRQKLFTCPPSTRVYPGHGAATTLQEEMLNNPCL